MLTKVISGGQTGADQAGLKAGKESGLETGGTVPKGYRTETGPNKKLIEYGCHEDFSSSYQPRTKKNIQDSDATLIFHGGMGSGSILTGNLCKRLKKPHLIITVNEFVNADVVEVANFIINNNVKILNIAGNRESVNPGIYLKVARFLICVFKHIKNNKIAEKSQS